MVWIIIYKWKSPHSAVTVKVSLSCLAWLIWFLHVLFLLPVPDSCMSATSFFHTGPLSLFGFLSRSFPWHFHMTLPSHHSIIRDSCQDGFILPCPSHFFSSAACCCIRKVFLERHNTHVYSFQIWSPWETKVLTPSKSNLVSFIRVMNRSKNDSKTVILPKCTPGQVAALYSWEPGTCCTPCRQLCCCKEGLLVHPRYPASLDPK